MKEKQGDIKMKILKLFRKKTSKDWPDAIDFDNSRLEDESYLFEKREQIINTLKVSLKNYTTAYLEALTGKKKPEQADELKMWEIEAVAALRVDITYSIVDEHIRNQKNNQK